MKTFFLTLLLCVTINLNSKGQWTNQSGTSNYYLVSGNVGIGTINPLKNLHINADGTADATIRLSATGNSAYYTDIINSVSSARSFAISTLGIDAFVVAGAGGYSGITIGNTSTNLLINPSSNTAAFLGCNVGIGTTSPAAKFEVYSGLSASTLTGAIIGNGSNDANAGIRINYRFSDAAVNLDGVYLDAVANADASGDKDFVVSTSGINATPTPKFIVRGNGNIGIGTTTPQANLDVAKTLNPGDMGSVLARLYEGNSTGTGTYLGIKGYNTQLSGSITNFNDIKSFAIEHSFYGETNSSINFLRGGGTTGGSMAFNTNNNTEQMRILYNGNVGIGITDPGNYKLGVNGTIHSKAVVVDLNGFPDYVFKTNYNLTPLSDLKTYIDKNHHLPEVPSAQEVTDKGLNLGEMNKILVKKVEELTLYLIEKDKEMKAQEEKMKGIERRLALIEKK